MGEFEEIGHNRSLPSTGVFCGLIFLLLWPIFNLSFLFTHDGPAHLYNACLIRRVISGNELASGLLHLKIFPEPNWTGHLLLAIFSSVLPPNIAERIFLGLYIVLFPFFFRRLLKKVNVNCDATVFLVLPFVYSYFFFGGLYNFLAGVTALFAAMSIILPQFERRENKRYLWILGFSLLLYFSHLLAFGVFLILIGSAHIFSYYDEKNKRPENNFFKDSIPLALTLIPSLILLAVFFANKLFVQSQGGSFSFSEMLESLFYITSIITLQYEPENIYSVVIFVLLIVVLIFSLGKKFNTKTKQTTTRRPFYQRSSYWTIATLMMLLLFFIIPDQAATGGVIKFRFELFFFLFLIVLINTFPSGKFSKGSVIVVITTWIILKFLYLFPMMKSLNEDTGQAMKITVHMKENSILLPLNYSANWMHCNLFNYAGTVKDILVLDNYEAGMPHFPLEWKADMNPVSLLGNFNGNLPLCADIKNYESKTKHAIDYIVLWNYNKLTDSCSVSIQDVLTSNYHIIFNEGENLKLYQRN